MTISGPGSTAAPIAVSEFKNLGGDDQGTASHDFVRILRHDLELSGFFSIISPKSYIEDPQNSGYDLGKFNFARLEFAQRRIPGQGRSHGQRRSGLGRGPDVRRRPAAPDVRHALFRRTGRRGADGAALRRLGAQGGNRHPGTVRHADRVRLDARRPFQGNLPRLARRRRPFPRHRQSDHQPVPEIRPQRGERALSFLQDRRARALPVRRGRAYRDSESAARTAM